MIAIQSATVFLLFVSVVALSIRYGKRSGYDTRYVRQEAFSLGCFILAFVLSLAGLVLRLISLSHQK